MELNANRMRGHSLDEDDSFSNISRISCGLHNSLNSACNSDSECSGPISVRDMIQHYNNQLNKEESSQVNHKIKYKINTAKRPHYHHSQHLLAATNSSYCGLNNYGSKLNANRCADQMEHKSSLYFNDYDPTALSCCKNCTACTCCQNRSRTNSTTTKMLSSPSSSSLLLQQNNENNEKSSSSHNTANNVVAGSGVCISSSNINCNKINAKDTHIVAVENCTTNIIDESAIADINAASIKPSILNDFSAAELNKDSNINGLFKKHSSLVVVEQQKNHLLSTDSVDEAKICQQPTIETSYQSKTTIAKTSSGVRIIIDIFFDQEQCANASDIVGSRLETDIPQSRILAEFQQQTMVANTCITTATTATASNSQPSL